MGEPEPASTRTPLRTVLFVCTGNTCRSPMAEALARHWVENGGLGGDVFVASAGLAAGQGVPPSTETLRTLARLGVDHRGSSKPLSAAMIAQADVVFCMTAAHRNAACALVGPNSDEARKIVLLDPGGDLHDPIGEGQEAYDALAARLIELIPRRLKESLDS